MKRFSKELKVNNESFNVKFGTINIKDKHSLYILGTTYIFPVTKKEDYLNDIYLMQKNIKFLTKKIIYETKCFSKNFMFDLDVRGSGVKFDKKSFLSFEIHLLHNNSFNKLSDINEDVGELVKNITKNFENILIKNDFNNSKKK